MSGCSGPAITGFAEQISNELEKQKVQFDLTVVDGYKLHIESDDLNDIDQRVQKILSLNHMVADIDEVAGAHEYKIRQKTVKELEAKDEEVDASQKYPVQSPFETKDSQFVSAGDKVPSEANMAVKEAVEEPQVDPVDIIVKEVKDFIPSTPEARETFNVIKEAGKLETLAFTLSDMYGEHVDAEDLNRKLAEDADWFFNVLNIKQAEIEE